MPKRAPVPRPESLIKERELGASGASLESVPPTTRRRFSASEKLRLVKAAEAAVVSGERGALAALLRKEGIYSSHLTAWRTQLGVRGIAGLTAEPSAHPVRDIHNTAISAVYPTAWRIISDLSRSM